MKKFFGKMEKWVENIAELIVNILVIGFGIALVLTIISGGVTVLYILLKYVYNFWFN